jgi:hypothetical protein
MRMAAGGPFYLVDARRAILPAGSSLDINLLRRL